MANRLQPILPLLVSNKQTAFVKGRSLIESFLVAREFISFCHKRKIPSILYKVDFEKAFDTVSWCYLINLLIERGFPPRWTAALLHILQTSTSTIRFNGNTTGFFKHKRGLRQGDPLSPMLFILVADSLNWMIQNSTPLMHPSINFAPQPIQYADDTIIIAEAHPTTLKMLVLILQLYAKLTGLRINNNKSRFVPIAIPAGRVSVIQQILSTNASELPIKYLGLPLIAITPWKIHFQPLIAAVERRVASWKSALLSFRGRLTLVKAILSALPLHYMQAM